jgi:hypothetical protein
MSEKFSPIDILALVVVLGNLALIACGKAGQLDFAFNAVIGFYFGHKVTESSSKIMYEQQQLNKKE